MEDKPVKPAWKWWDTLRKTGKLQDLHDGDVHFGYYRKPSGSKNQRARWVPVGIWPVSDKPSAEVVVEVDGRPSNMRPFDAIFSKYLQGVSYEDYMAVTRKGEPWKDEPPQAPTPPDLQRDRQGEWQEVEPQRVPAADRAVTRHDNLPPQDHKLLIEHQVQLSEEQLLVGRRLQKAITTQDEANSTSEHANRIAALGKWFEAEYEVRNRPLLEQQKMLRVDYLHRAQEAQGLAKALTQHMADFLLAEQRRLAEHAERVRQAAAAEAAAQGTPPEQQPAPEPPPKAGAGGLTGRRTTVREEPIAIVEDYLVWATKLIHGGMVNPPANYCSSAELKTLLDALANKMAKVLPVGPVTSGVRVEKQAKARR